MPITVYSQRFNRELDIEQLLSLRGHQTQFNLNIIIKSLSAQEKKEIFQDIFCPVCRSGGGKTVLASKSKQAHFRFDNHDYFCDYNKAKNNKSQKGKIVNFGNDKSYETKIVRELVAKGIEQKIISQQLINEMRKYFYDIKINSQYTINIPVNAFEWWIRLKYFSHVDIKNTIKFQPSHALLPSFEWRLASRNLFLQENIELIQIASDCDFLLNDKNHKLAKNLAYKAQSLVRNIQESVVFDVTKLQIPYQKTIELARFIAINLSIKDEKGKYCISSNIVMAFAALLLYFVNWDIQLAILKLIEIVQSPTPIDMNSGNIIGFYPFCDFEIWATIAKVREVTKYSKNGFDYDAQIEAIEARLKQEYEQWKLEMQKLAKLLTEVINSSENGSDSDIKTEAIKARLKQEDEEKK